jgi:hypothetical protein
MSDDVVAGDPAVRDLDLDRLAAVRARAAHRPVGVERGEDPEGVPGTDG